MLCVTGTLRCLVMRICRQRSDRIHFFLWNILNTMLSLKHSEYHFELTEVRNGEGSSEILRLLWYNPSFFFGLGSMAMNRVYLCRLELRIIKLINIRENCIFKSNSLMPSESLPRLVQRPTPHSVRRVTFPKCSVHLHQGGQIFHGIGDKPNNSLKYQFFSFDFYFSPPGSGTGLSQNLNVTVHVWQFCTGISKKYQIRNCQAIWGE